MVNAKVIKVIYAEEHKGLRQLICDYLESRGNIAIVLQTDNGYEVIEALKQSISLPDICVIGISMAVMDGITLLKKIKKRYPGLPCLIYSMHHNKNTIVKALGHGANAYLTKREDHAELYRTIMDVLDSGYAYTQAADQETLQQIRTGQVKPLQLSNREKQLMKYAATDDNWHQIAKRMGVRLSTVMTYRSRCFKKLKVKSRVSLALQAVKLGLVSI